MSPLPMHTVTPHTPPRRLSLWNITVIIIVRLECSVGLRSLHPGKLPFFLFFATRFATAAFLTPIRGRNGTKKIALLLHDVWQRLHRFFCGTCERSLCTKIYHFLYAKRRCQVHDSCALHRPHRGVASGFIFFSTGSHAGQLDFPYASRTGFAEFTQGSQYAYVE